MIHFNYYLNNDTHKKHKLSEQQPGDAHYYLKESVKRLTHLSVNTFCVVYAVRTMHSGFTVCTVCKMLLNLKQSTVRLNVLFGSFSYEEQKI